MNTLEVLKAARERIAVPERWTTKAVARNARGGLVKPRSPNAACWCGSGAIVAVTPESEMPDDWHAHQASMALAKTAGVRWFPGFNDTHEHADVLAMFDKTIARLESESAT